jgi:hypothetical protein
VIDPSAASFRLTWQRRSGGWPTPADNTVLDGIRDLASLIGCDYVRFHRSCRSTVDEMTGYVWDPKAQERGDDAPLKVADHGPDTLRYGARHLRRHWRHWLGRPVVADALEEEAA